jgi:hypothetical protein
LLVRAEAVGKTTSRPQSEQWALSPAIASEPNTILPQRQNAEIVMVA